MKAYADHLRELIATHQNALAGLESGKVRMFKSPGTDQEITAEWIVIYKNWIAELETVLAGLPTG